MKRKIKIAPRLKACTVRAFIRRGNTLRVTANHFGFKTIKSLYDRFGDEIKGVAPKGRRWP